MKYLKFGNAYLKASSIKSYEVKRQNNKILIRLYNGILYEQSFSFLTFKDYKYICLKEKDNLKLLHSLIDEISSDITKALNITLESIEKEDDGYCLVNFNEKVALILDDFTKNQALKKLLEEIIKRKEESLFLSFYYRWIL
ncbi:hypothetical protein [Campylobacter sp. VTCC 70190]|uniref:hypothetical protein n=1 Tax=Campylobacter sp. VTCC 70190 TaxID=3392118 RepID=UPI00398F8E0D